MQAFGKLKFSVDPLVQLLPETLVLLFQSLVARSKFLQCRLQRVRVLQQRCVRELVRD